METLRIFQYPSRESESGLVEKNIFKNQIYLNTNTNMRSLEKYFKYSSVNNLKL